MISAGELALLRREAERFLPDVAIVRRHGAPTQDPAHGETPGAATDTEVACRVAPTGLSPTEQFVAQQLQGRASVIVTMPAGTDVKTTDQVIMQSGGFVGRVLEVVYVGERSLEISRRVLCALT